MFGETLILGFSFKDEMYSARIHMRLLPRLMTLINCLEVCIGAEKVSHLFIDRSLALVAAHMESAEPSGTTQPAQPFRQWWAHLGADALGWVTPCSCGKDDSISWTSSMVFWALLSRSQVCRYRLLLGSSAPTFLIDSLYHSCPESLSHDSRSYRRECNKNIW